jgi:hypothetical protein
LQAGAGAATNVPLTSTLDSFEVNSESFITQEYPTDPTNPTKTVKETSIQSVKYTTGWAIGLYVVLILIFLVLSILFIYRIKKAP